MVQRCFSHLLRHVKSSVIFEGIFPEACTLTNAECFLFALTLSLLLYIAVRLRMRSKSAQCKIDESP
jgi:hypothetical protein